MTREEYIKFLIKQKGYTLKEFSNLVEIPYTTLLSMLKPSIGGAAVESVIKICQALDIPVELLKNEEISDEKLLPPFQVSNFTEEEINHIKKYRALDERGKAAVDTTLEREYEFIKRQSEDTANEAI